MAAIITTDFMQEILDNYYISHFGVRDSDFWHPAPAVNVRCFSRDGKVIAIKCHILTGDVTEHIEDISI